MSFVGPRPELPEIVRGYDVAHHTRHLVRPGLTGLWQVTARGDGSLMKEHVALDVRYVETASFWVDLRIVLLTLRSLSRGS